MSPYRGMDKWDVRRAIRKDLRDALLFLGGLAGIANEATRAGGPRESLLLLFGAMIGVIPFLHLDEWMRQRPTEPPPEEKRDDH